jgi:hypothetical protein
MVPITEGSVTRRWTVGAGGIGEDGTERLLLCELH